MRADSKAGSYHLANQAATCCLLLLFGDSTTMPVEPELESIFTLLQEGQCGEFCKTFNTIKSYLPEKDFLVLPRLIVVGFSSAGKSSVLENITKKAIFPRDKTVCTKFPIILHVRPGQTDIVNVMYNGSCSTLNNANDVRGTVTRFMAEPDRYLSNEELVVEVTQPAMPTLQFIDLPAIRNNLCREQAMDLSAQYLMDNNTLVLCVAEADALLEDCAALDIVHATGKLQQTILVLTHADRAAADKAKAEDMFDKLLGIGPGNESLGQLKGIVAVVNRKHTDEMSLADATAAEESIFDSLLSAATGRYAADNVQQTLRSRMTTKKLMEQIVSLYSSHMQVNWLPRMLDAIEAAQQELAAEIADRSPDPRQLHVKELLFRHRALLIDQFME